MNIRILLVICFCSSIILSQTEVEEQKKISISLSTSVYIKNFLAGGASQKWYQGFLSTLDLAYFVKPNVNVGLNVGFFNNIVKDPTNQFIPKMNYSNIPLFITGTYYFDKRKNKISLFCGSTLKSYYDTEFVYGNSYWPSVNEINMNLKKYETRKEHPLIIGLNYQRQIIKNLYGLIGFTSYMDELFTSYQLGLSYRIR